ncbi:MAG TPA: DUF3300 domain-containing protein [Cellvibrio sp.]|mgnify:CR=1 FL=1|nr:DUF3300 domain-containing protein [Cellvibrio sp.]
MKLLSTRYLSSLAKSFQKLVFGLMMVMPLLAVSPASLAAEQDGIEFSQAELDQMLAPIALYPDALLSQVLIASTYPLEVIQADRWVRSNKDLKAEDALKFAENKDWDPSIKSLVAFPDILKRMSEDVDWTQRLGDAFLSNEGEVMDAVQRLRKRAYATGNLEKAQHITVERDDNHIIIEPAEERIVYVPVYDTRVVYGNWWWPEYPPVYWNYPSHYTYTSGFYWGSSIFVGSTYFYSSPRWRDRRIVVIDRHHHHNTHFYTGRSIVRHDSARHWSHNPAHRHGVAYYNNRLRDTYKSPRPSYQHDRQYRDQHRGHDRDDHRNQGVIRNGNDGNGRYDPRRPNNGNTNVRPFDRSEQVRERLNRTNNNGANNNGVSNRVSTDSNNRENRPWQHNNGNREVNRPNQRENGPNFSVPSQEVNTNTSPNRDISRDETTNRRAAMQTERNNGVEQNVARQERQIIRDSDNHRAVFQGATERAREQQTVNTGPQQRIERHENPTFSPPRNESRAEQRLERASNPRFTREKKDDENK